MFKQYNAKYVTSYKYTNDDEDCIDTLKFVANLKTLEIFENITGEDLYKMYEEQRNALTKVFDNNMLLMQKIVNAKNNFAETQKLNEEHKDALEKINKSILSLGLEEKTQAFRHATFVSMFAAANPKYIEDILVNSETCLPTEVFQNDILFSELLGLLQSFYPIVKKKRAIEMQA